MSLKKISRIHLRQDFDNIFKKGQAIHSPEITLRYLANKLEVSRIAVIIAKKTAKKAVLRNKLRRQIKEIIRPRLVSLSNLDLIFILKTPIVDKKFSEIKTIVEGLLNKIK